MISTKGRYSIRILLDLAEHGSSGGYTPMKEVAVRQEISLKYIERILPPLKNAGLIASTHGIGGGGLGKIAINYGYYRYQYIVMAFAVIFLILLVQIFQSVGTKLVAKCDKRLK